MILVPFFVLLALFGITTGIEFADLDPEIFFAGVVVFVVSSICCGFAVAGFLTL